MGGVGGLALFALIVFLFMRWRRKRALDDEFDGDFDPGRLAVAGGRSGGPPAGGTLPKIAVLPEEDDGMGGRLAASDLGIRGTVTPFYNPNTGALPQQEMSEKARMSVAQNAGNAYSPAGSSHGSPHSPPVTFPMPQIPPAAGSSTDAGYAYSPSVGSSSTGAYYTRVPLQPQQHQFHSPPTSEPSSSSRGDKEPNHSPFVSNPEENANLVVHQDGGRVVEIPPSYDSLPPNERR